MISGDSLIYSQFSQQWCENLSNPYKRQMYLGVRSWGCIQLDMRHIRNFAFITRIYPLSAMRMQDRD